MDEGRVLSTDLRQGFRDFLDKTTTLSKSTKKEFIPKVNPKRSFFKKTKGEFVNPFEQIGVVDGA